MIRDQVTAHAKLFAIIVLAIGLGQLAHRIGPAPLSARQIVVASVDLLTDAIVALEQRIVPMG